MTRPIIIIILTFSSLITNAQIINEITKDSIRTVICKMLSEDQRVRTEKVDVRIRKQTDSINFYQLTVLTKKFGFPDKKRIGDSDCSVNPFIILLHNPDKIIQTENYELFIAECRKGNISGWELGLALDRYYFHYYKKSMFGCYGGSKPCIDDIELVNKNRKDLGLKELREDEFKTCR